MPIEGTLALTYIPLLCLYIGLIAWLTFDASQDSNWFVWLLVFLFTGPVGIVFYIVTSRIARRATSQNKLDSFADEKRELGSEFKFRTELDRAKWMHEQSPTTGTMFEPSVGLSLRTDRHVTRFSDPHAEQLLAAGEEAAAFDYLAGMYAIAVEQGDLQRVAGLCALIAAKISQGEQRLKVWETTGSDPGVVVAEKPKEISAPKVQNRTAPF